MARLRNKKRVTKAKASATELVRCFCNKYGCNGDLTARSTCRRHAASDFQLAEELGSASNLPSLFSDPNSTGDPDDLPDLPEAVEEFEDPLTNPLDELFDSIDIDSKLYPDNPTSNITLGEVLLSMFDLIAAHKLTGTLTSDIWAMLRTVVPEGTDVGTHKLMKRIIRAHLKQAVVVIILIIRLSCSNLYSSS